MLDRVDDARRLLVSPPVAAAAALVANAEAEGDSAPGRRIGAYSVVREIGRGGMSRVFLAERADGEFEQRVAVKLLRPGLDSDIDRARFRAERQIVASLNHPNVARLLDGGITEEGQPYLVLEYVDGEPIDVYCNARALPIRRRIELFLMVAGATQYAHRNLIVHRDIKPSNILVSDDGMVKLLDFGLAKLLEPGARPNNAAAALTTAHWMTPEYAAPEQIRRGAVTTLTDVYQLGVVLYRLLTGRLPFRVDDGGLRGLEAAVVAGHPLPPSAVVSEFRWAKQLRGDLDAIVLKATNREPDERYASVEALADDLRRHLQGHAVRARRGSALYRARRLVRRHSAGTLATLGVSLALVAGAAFSVAQARRAAKERDIAAVASRESQAVTAFVMGLFETSDPAETRGDTLTAHELVRRAAARADLLQAQPLAQARMLSVTGRLYNSLGRYRNASEMFARALAIEQSAGAGRSPEAAGTLNELAAEFIHLDRYGAADSAAREALRIQTNALGPLDPGVAVALRQLGSIAVFRGQLSLADSFQRRALAVRERALGPDDSLTALSHVELGSTLRLEGRGAEAEREFRAGLSILERTVSPDNPHLADALMQIAYLLDEDRGDVRRAEPLYQRALDTRRRAYGDAHPMVAAALMDLAEFRARQRDDSAAVADGREALRIMRRTYGAEHPEVITFTGRLGAVIRKSGSLEEAAALYREAIAANQRLRGRDHATNAGLEMGLVQVLIAQNRLADAERSANEAIRVRTLVAGPSAPGSAEAEGLLGLVLSRERRYVAADSVLRESLHRLERQMDRSQHNVREIYGWLADLDDARARYDDAARHRAIANAR